MANARDVLQVAKRVWRRLTIVCRVIRANTSTWTSAKTSVPFWMSALKNSAWSQTSREFVFSKNSGVPLDRNWSIGPVLTQMLAKWTLPFVNTQIRSITIDQSVFRAPKTTFRFRYWSEPPFYPCHPFWANVLTRRVSWCQIWSSFGVWQKLLPCILCG